MMKVIVVASSGKSVAHKLAEYVAHLQSVKIINALDDIELENINDISEIKVISRYKESCETQAFYEDNRTKTPNHRRKRKGWE